MYGPKHVQSYRADIYELYKLGEEDKKNKRSPAQMREALQMKYPQECELCLPSENVAVPTLSLETRRVFFVLLTARVTGQNVSLFSQ